MCYASMDRHTFHTYGPRRTCVHASTSSSSSMRSRMHDLCVSASPSARSLCSQPDGDEEAVSDKCFITKTRVVSKGGSLLVEAFVPADVASSSQALLATLHWRVNWGEENPVTMEEQGAQNNQRVFAVTLPAAAVMQTGSMVRWRVGVRASPSQRLLCGTSRLVLLRTSSSAVPRSTTTTTCMQLDSRALVSSGLASPY
jgi:hypothetical protein